VTFDTSRGSDSADPKYTKFDDNNMYVTQLIQYAKGIVQRMAEEGPGGRVAADRTQAVSELFGHHGITTGDWKGVCAEYAECKHVSQTARIGRCVPSTQPNDIEGGRLCEFVPSTHNAQCIHTTPRFEDSHRQPTLRADAPSGPPATPQPKGAPSTTPAPPHPPLPPPPPSAPRCGSRPSVGGCRRPEGPRGRVR
jgi:hypothetical protein